MNKSMMDLYVKFELEDGCLREITKKEYEKYLNSNEYQVPQKMKFCDISIWKDVFNEFDYPPHPLKQIIVLEDWYMGYGESGMSGWALVFLFKHKGKYYIFADVDSN